MAHSHILSDEAYKSQKSAVIRATVWLSVITLIEVAAALLWLNLMSADAPKMLLNGFFIAASLLKAYFIVGEFMHVNYEDRALALTILVPTVFLIWFIIAFLWEGSEWKENRNDWGVTLEKTWEKRAEDAKHHDDHSGDHGHGEGDGHGHDHGGH
ncbi:MAG: cytochrome C oxidase subunit IV family protein [Chitinophagales bacterium]